MNIAYFTNQYPKVSHSFIRREILAMEALGHTVERFALRSEISELVDIYDKNEFSKTSYILFQPKLNIVMDCFRVLFQEPTKFFLTLLFAVKLGFRSDRGVLRHLAYFVESCVLFLWQKQKRIEHVHAHFGTNSTMVVMFAYLLGGSGYSFTVHGPEEFDKPEFISLAEKIKHSRFVVAISSFGRSQIYRWIPLTQWEKVKIVHCTVDNEVLDAPLKDFPEKIEFVSVGRLSEQKGQLLMVEALHQLKQRGIDIKLTLVGDGPLKDEIKILINDYNLAENIVLTGSLSGKDVMEAIDNSSIMLLPSFAEGLPVVIMESLARCRPVLSTYIAGIPELIVPNETGWLIPAGDVDALVKQIEKILTLSKSELKKIGQLGREAILREHSAEIEAQKLASFIKAAIKVKS